jgi:molecular chaperone GrpE
VTGTNPVGPRAVGSDEFEPTGPKVTDKRRLDPSTGAVRDATPVHDDFSELEQGEAGPGDEDVESLDVDPDTTLVADLTRDLVDLTRDLQRVQAEYVNYKKRVDRDRALHHHVAVSSVFEALLPVLDDIHLARQHGDLEGGPFAAIADKLEGILTKFGVERFGQPGEAFDPSVHEALMHSQAELAEGTEVATVVQVMQPGYRMGERLIRAARVAVADPQ